MIKHYESLSLFENFSLLLQLHHLPFFDHFNGIEFAALFREEYAAVRPLSKHTHEFEI